MTLILIKKENFYFKNLVNNGNWTLSPLEGCNFASKGLATSYIQQHLKELTGCAVVEVDVTFTEKP